MSDVDAKCLVREEPEILLCKNCTHSETTFHHMFCKHPKSDAWGITEIMEFVDIMQNTLKLNNHLKLQCGDFFKKFFKFF